MLRTTHYGTEWDWLSFYWNLWVDASTPFTVAEIAEVWDQVPNEDTAFFCCHETGGAPDDCLPDMDGDCIFPGPRVPTAT